MLVMVVLQGKVLLAGNTFLLILNIVVTDTIRQARDGRPCTSILKSCKDQCTENQTMIFCYSFERPPTFELLTPHCWQEILVCWQVL